MPVNRPRYGIELPGAIPGPRDLLEVHEVLASIIVGHEVRLPLTVPPCADDGRDLFGIKPPAKLMSEEGGE